MRILLGERLGKATTTISGVRVPTGGLEARSSSLMRSRSARHGAEARALAASALPKWTLRLPMSRM